MQGGAFNAVDTEAQEGMILTEAQKNTLDAYLALDHASEALKFDEFPEWEEVLTQLQTAETPAAMQTPGFSADVLRKTYSAEA